MGLIADLGRGPVAIDTAVFISFIEEDPRFLPLIDPLFREADQGSRELVTMCHRSPHSGHQPRARTARIALC